MAGSNGGPNLTRRLIAVGVNGAPTKVFATGPCRGWRCQESPVTTPGNAAQASQGFEVQIPNDGTAGGFTTWFARPANSANFSPNDNFFENFNVASEHGANGEVFAGPGGALGAGIGTTAATLLCNLESLTATATTIEFVEYF